MFKLKPAQLRITLEKSTPPKKIDSAKIQKTRDVETEVAQYILA